MPVAGPALGAAVTDMLAARGIRFHALHKLTAVNLPVSPPSKGKSPIRYDLPVAVPPRNGPRLPREAGLVNDAGWMPVDRRRLATSQERVHAIGDSTPIPIPGRWKPGVPLMLPKAGVFAHAQA